MMIGFHCFELIDRKQEIHFRSAAHFSNPFSQSRDKIPHGTLSRYTFEMNECSFGKRKCRIIHLRDRPLSFAPANQH